VVVEEDGRTSSPLDAFRNGSPGAKPPGSPASSSLFSKATRSTPFRVPEAEAKEDASYTLQKALVEIEEARKNRDAGVGLFIFFACNAPDGSEPFGRYGNDVVLVWDAEDPRSDAVLVAGLSVARALCARSRARSDAEAADFDSIERAILEIEKQARGLDEMTRSAETIKSGSERIIKRAEIMRRAFGDQIEALTEKVRDLQRLLGEQGTE
jgi:hypothetical protein